MSEETFNVDGIQTVILSMGNLDNNASVDQLKFIKTVFKPLSDGTVCIVDPNDLNLNQYFQVPLENNSIILNADIQNIPIQDTNLLQPPDNEDKQTDQTIPVPATIYKCSKCNEAFSKIALYKKHVISHKTTKKYKCTECPASYNVETNYKIHMAMHSSGGKPTCPICKVSFQRTASLKSHLMIHQVEELYNCDECSDEFEKEEELNRHLQTHLNTSIDNNNMVCSYCKVKFEDPKQYKEHISDHIKVKKMVLTNKKTRKTQGNREFKHVCKECHKSFSKASLLKRHLRVHSGEKPFICDFCNKGFTQKGTLQIHLIKHKGLKPFHCTLCPAKFNQKGNLRVHVEKTHVAPQAGVNFYKCTHCSCIFKKIASLNIHVTKTHSADEELQLMNQLKELEAQTATVTPDMKAPEREIVEQNKKFFKELKETAVPNTSYVKLAESFVDGSLRRYLIKQKKIGDVRWYLCSYCTKEFKKPSDLIRHTRIHTREKPFACKSCNARFTLKSSLFCHMKRHSCNTDLTCSVCLQKFTSIRLLNYHLKKHHQQYKCIDCNKIFPTFQKIKIHNREVHNSETIETQPPTQNGSDQNLICHLCNISFTKLADLNRHMQIHNKNKQFKCEQCSKTYSTPRAFKEHLMCHSGTKNFPCKMCGKRFMTSTLLKRHSVCHNNDKLYSCSVCNKSFKRPELCKRHMNLHKNNLEDETEKGKLLHIPDNFPADVLFTEKIKLTTEQNIDKTNLEQQLPIPDQIPSQLYEVSSNPIQIITNPDKDGNQDPNSIQTIFINCQDFHLEDNLYPQVKIPNGETMLFSTMNELPVSTGFSVDPIGDGFETNAEIYNTNHIFNLSDTTPTLSISEIASKVLKATEQKQKPEKNSNTNVILNNINLNDNILTTSNPSYYSNPDFNILFNLESDLNTCDLPNENLNLPDITSVTPLPIEEPKETESCNTDIVEDDKKAKEFNCEQCKKNFSTKETLKKHINSHNKSKTSGGKLHECTFCKKPFKKQSDLIRHNRTHTGEKPFGCDLCEKKFSLKSTLLAHQRTHNPVSHKNYNCNVCNSFFTSKSSLRVHMNIHTGAKPHQCNFCRLKFHSSAHRKSHEANHHSNDNTTNKKKIKNKVINLLESMAMDELDQPEQQQQQNIEDQLISGGANDLENVLVVQEQLQLHPNELNILNQTTTANQNTIGESIQLGQMILPSNFLLQDQFSPLSIIQLDDGTYLNIKTTNNGDLIPEEMKQIDLSGVLETQPQPTEPVVVQQQQQKPKNLECDVCHKKYASKDVLRKHKKIHLRKHPCTKCERSFDALEELEKHERTHLGGRPFACEYCNNCFAKAQGLVTHLKRIHQISKGKRLN